MRQFLLLCIFAMLPHPLSANEPAEPKKPNVLFAIADDWSFAHASAYGNKWVKTPAFDRVAKQGILFNRAYVPNAKCAPCRACVLTGRNSWQLEQACNHVCFYPAKFKSYVEALGENGYFVGFTGKGWGPGIANDNKGKSRQMTGKPYQKRNALVNIKGISRRDYAGNFADFIKDAPKDKPWCFWYGATEPHRGYEYGIGVKKGKKLTDIEHVPEFFPDNETIRNDLLDYAVEVEHFDMHLGRMLALLEKSGQLDNTLIIVTSDHGMPFPRCKGQAYDYSNHVPLAISWKKGLNKPGRVVDDYVSLIDVAPTILEVAGLAKSRGGMQPITGKSLLDVIKSEKSGQVNENRDHVLIGKERHDIGRPNDWGYPIRGIVKDNVLYIKNYETSRWPGGNPETGYLNCDGGPTKSFILNARRENANDLYWRLCFGKRPAEELYDLKKDPDCVSNLADEEEYAATKKALREQMVKELKEQGDPRMFGKGEIFDKYVYSNKGTRGFYERFMKGEKIRAGWVNPTDFEKKPLDK